MWLCTSTSFLSVVADRDNKDRLLVRARREGDIETVFPRAKVIKTPHADYLYRTSISRQLVAEAVAKCINDIQYVNFKNSVPEQELHDGYLEVWGTMRRMQKTQSQNKLIPSNRV